jgi:hypothetical protein
MKGGIKKVAFDVLCNITKCNFLQSVVAKRAMKKGGKQNSFSTISIQCSWMHKQR